MVSKLHHGFTTQVQPWPLGSSLSHLLGNSRTCDDYRLPPGASPRVAGSLINGWMGRPAEAEEIYRGARRSKGVANRHENGLGRPSWSRFGPVRPSMLLRQLLTSSLMHVGHLHRLLHGIDRAPCRASFSIFCSGPWSFTASCFNHWAIWSHVDDVS
jgi:hypothetical protein